MYDTICIATERPTEIHFDFEKRTHNDKGLAIKYADGNGVAIYHGVRIPNEWVLGNLPSAAKALSWPQIEQRRAACELIGWKNILNQLNSRVINTDVDPLIGELIECDLPDSPNEKFLRVMCGTGREFVLSVPKEMKTALEANAWTYGIPSDMLTKKFVRT